MSAVIVVFTADHHLSAIIGPFDTAQEAADHNATLGATTPVMIAALTPPEASMPCQYTFAHTRHWCGHPGCRES